MVIKGVQGGAHGYYGGTGRSAMVIKGLQGGAPCGYREVHHDYEGGAGRCAMVTEGVE